MRWSFFHGGDATMASYRYRAARPAAEVGVPLNDRFVDVLIFSKPVEDDLTLMRWAHQTGRGTIVDTCDIHYTRFPWIRTMLQEATALTCNTSFTQRLLREDLGREATIIDDPYEYEECAPHCTGVNLLWFGHPTNADSVNRIMAFGEEYPLTIVTNAAKIAGSGPNRIVPWSIEALRDEFAQADIVVIPETAPHKSANRAIESIRQGCFVVAEPHPSLMAIPGIYIGNLRKGIAWAQAYPAEARTRTRQAQAYVRDRYSLAQVGNAWRTAVQACHSILAQGISTGTAGPTLTVTEATPQPI